MVIVDSNVLLYAYSTGSEYHADARRWLEQALGGTEPVGFSWLVILSFLRVLTSPKIMKPPVSLPDAVSVVDAWLERDTAVVVHPGRAHWSTLRELLRESGSKGNLVNDAHLAALALENGAAICSFDRDFRRFSKLRLLIPEHN